MKSRATYLGVFLLAMIHICHSSDDVQALNEVEETTDANNIDDEFTTLEPLLNPCLSSPCGPHAECFPKDDGYSCECLPNFINRPPNCRAECTTNNHCINNQTCVEQLCVDPCLDDICGVNADCFVIDHIPICECPQNSTGDAFVECLFKETHKENNPCDPNPCGENTMCREQNGVFSCLCLPNFYGNPDQGCKPKCNVNSDCPSNFMCLQSMCFDPCPGTCPENADCLIENHLPICVCKEGYTGNAYQNCSKIEQNDMKIDPCEGNPCGPNSQCKNVKDIAACSCLPNFNGSPPDCTSGCVSSSECDMDRACANHTCVDPCNGNNVCGKNTNCTVVNHSPVCNCLENYAGDPLSECHPLLLPPFTHPCVISPCGPNSECRLDGDGFTCHCLRGFTGSPPNCKPECVSNFECSSNMSCIDKHCKDPCANDICGENATCHVKNHTPNCQCPENYSGDPFVACSSDDVVTTTILPDKKSLGECNENSDCPDDKACFDQRCDDLCIDVCGKQAECIVIQHKPTCSCNAGYTGDPFVECYDISNELAPKERAQDGRCRFRH